MNHKLNILNNTEFIFFSDELRHDITLKLQYEYYNDLLQTSLPLINVGVVNTNLYSTRDDIGIVYHCMLYMHIKLSCIRKNWFNVFIHPVIKYGVAETHPDTITTDIESLECFFDKEDCNNIMEGYRIVEFGINKTIDKAIKTLDEWKRTESKKTIEYLLKE